ncbi:MAG: hypothetical protein HQ521_01160 [Bacteroidetes bacterium]|nr:hypothetical protein [Bacteroidota bacterium]
MPINKNDNQSELDRLKLQIEKVSEDVDTNKLTIEPSQEYLDHLDALPKEIKKSLMGMHKTISEYFTKQKSDKRG